MTNPTAAFEARCVAALRHLTSSAEWRFGDGEVRYGTRDGPFGEVQHEASVGAGAFTFIGAPADTPLAAVRALALFIEYEADNRAPMWGDVKALDAEHDLLLELDQYIPSQGKWPVTVARAIEDVRRHVANLREQAAEERASATERDRVADEAEAAIARVEAAGR